MNTIGQYIKNKRIENALRVNDISKELKIRKQYIIAIEKDDIDYFNSKIYYYGYLKQYLKLLKISDVEISIDEKVKKLPLSIDIPKIEKTNPNFTYIIMSIVCIIILYYVCSTFVSRPS